MWTLRRIGMGWLLLSVSVVTGCGDNAGDRCDATDTEWREPTCTAALVFAARDTIEVIPTQREIDRYYDRWSRVATAEPIFLDVGPQTYRSNGPGGAVILTTNPAVIAAWPDAYGVPVPDTGDSAFDDVIAELVAPTLYGRFDFTSGVVQFTLGTDTVFNEERLNALLVPTQSSLLDPLHRSAGDGQWTWVGETGSGSDDATADIAYTVGWGDCISGCAWFHSFRAIVPAVGRATVYDLGGDPLPEGVELSPDTIPSP